MNLDKLVIFDCDGTLVDSEEIAATVFTGYWATHGVQVSEMEFRERFIGTGNDHPDWKSLYEKMPLASSEEGDRLWHQALKENLQSVPGMEKIIASVTTQICVGSNSSLNHLQFSLEKTKLDKYFGRNVFSSEQVPNAKPAPDLFLFACEQMNVKTNDAIVIEDSISGVMAAKNAGINVIAFTGATHFTPTLRDRLISTEPTWICEDAEAIRERLKLLGFI